MLLRAQVRVMQVAAVACRLIEVWKRDRSYECNVQGSVQCILYNVGKLLERFTSLHVSDPFQTRETCRTGHT